MSASSQPAPSCPSSPPFLSCLPHVLSPLVLSCPSSTVLLPPSLPRPRRHGCGHLQLHHPAPARSAAVSYCALTSTCEKGDQPQGFDQHMREWQESPAARRSALARRATASAYEKGAVVAYNATISACEKGHRQRLRKGRGSRYNAPISACEKGPHQAAGMPNAGTYGALVTARELGTRQATQDGPS